MTRMSPVLARLKLPGHDLRRKPGRVDAAIWGVILLLMAIAPALIWLGVILVKRGDVANLFPQTSLVFVVCWCLLACCLFGQSIRRRAAPLARYKPRNATALAAARAGAILLVAFMPINYVMIGGLSHMPARDRWLLLIPNIAWIFALPDIMVLLILGNAVYLHLRYRKFGAAECRFADEPRLGHSNTATFFCARTLGHCRVLTFTLRCVEEVVEYHPAGRNSSSRQTTVYQIWGQDLRYEDETFDIPGQKFELSFDLPSGDVIQQAATVATRYWELEVTADVPGINFNALFAVTINTVMEQALPI